MTRAEMLAEIERINAAIVAAEREGGVRLDINKTLEEAGKIGGQISAQLGGNPAKIAKLATNKPRLIIKLDI